MALLQETLRETTAGGAPQASGAGALGVAGIAVSVASFLVAAAALYYARQAWLSSRRSTEIGERTLRVSEEQLRLAREQIDARPKLRVSEIRLTELDEAGISKRVEPFDKERKRKIRWEQDREAREERERREEEQRTPEERRLREETERLTGRLLLPPPAPRPPNPVPFRETPRGYEGSIPDKALLVTVVNDGDEAAYEVAGWLRLEARYLEPARLFSSPNAVVSSDDGFYRVRVGGSEKATLHGTRSAQLRFRVAVAVRSSGTTRVEYDFTPAVGDGDRGHELLELSDSS